MRVARLHAVADLRLADEPVPVPGPGESLVRVTAVGICGSDLHWWDQGGIGDAALDHPLVLGHEAAGVIEEGPRRGQRVAIDPAIPDGTCRPCREGYYNLCLNIRFAGHGKQDGAMREFMTWPDELLHPLPDEVSDAAGAVLEPLGVAIHAFDLGHVRLGAPVVVVGAGPIGLLLVQLLQVSGAGPVTVFEPLPHRRAAAAALGAAVADPAEAADPAALRALVGEGAGRGVRDRGQQRGGAAGHGGHVGRRPGGAGRHPGRRHDHVPRRGGPPQGAHDRHGAPDERGLPPGHRAGRQQEGRPDLAGHRPLPAGGRGHRLRQRGPPHRPQSHHRPRLTASQRPPGKGSARPDDAGVVAEPLQDVGTLGGPSRPAGLADRASAMWAVISSVSSARRSAGSALAAVRQPPQVVGNELIVVVINHRRISCSGSWQLTRRLPGRCGPGRRVLGRAGQQLIDAVAQLPPGVGEIGESLPPGLGEPVVPAGRPGR